MLDQDVAPGHAKVGTAVLHIGRHIAGTHQHDAHVGLVGGQDQLAGGFGVFEHLDAGGLQQRQGFFKDTAFGEGQGDGGTGHGVSSF